jgi:hypothetical protein
MLGFLKNYPKKPFPATNSMALVGNQTTAVSFDDLLRFR